MRGEPRHYRRAGPCLPIAAAAMGLHHGHFIAASDPHLARSSSCLPTQVKCCLGSPHRGQKKFS